MLTSLKTRQRAARLDAAAHRQIQCFYIVLRTTSSCLVDRNYSCCFNMNLIFLRSSQRYFRLQRDRDPPRTGSVTVEWTGTTEQNPALSVR